jgi:hypothetical protein
MSQFEEIYQQEEDDGCLLIEELFYSEQLKEELNSNTNTNNKN